MKRILLPLLTLSALTVYTLFAQDAPQYDQGQQVAEPDGQYEQGRAVARLSVLSGDVSVRRGDSGDVTAAAVNGPLMAGDTLLTSSSSRAEIQLDYGKVLRVGPNSEVRFSGMDIKNFQVQIAAGTVTFRVLRPSESQAELDTPSVAVHPLRQGVYRVGVREDGTSEITVRSGEAEIYSQKGTERLSPGRTMYARGSSTDPEFQVSEAIPLDSWDRWNEDRDRYLERSRSYEHVSRDVYGAEDLDQYGQWQNDPTYGSVWAPRVDPGWAPYRDGRWTWEDYYGWTWVSADPWGWAPYHYGRWFVGAGGGWCWYPGSIYARHYWAPAYVGFFGYGGRVGFGFGFGGLGWVPLAPYEGFHPWWGRGFYGGFRNGGFANRVNIINNTNITNVYRNARVAGGVTGVNAGEFGRRSGRFETLNQGHLQQAGLVRGVVPVSPERASLRMSDRAVNGNFPQSRAQSFASHMQTPQVNRVPFEQQQRGMQQISRGNFSGAGNSGAGGIQSPRSGGAFNNNPGNSPGSATHGWNRFGEPIHGGSAPQNQLPSGVRSTDNGGRSSGGGWQRFENTRPKSSGERNFAPGQGGSSGAVRISPPIVSDRSPSYQQSPRYESPRNSNPSYQAPPQRNYSPSYQAPERNYNPGYQAPRNSSPSYQAPERNYSPGYQAPQRNYSPSYQAPRNSNPSYQAPPQHNYSPRYEAPRNNGGGGGGGSRSAPSNGGGGGGRGNNGGGGGRSSGGNGGHR